VQNPQNWKPSGFSLPQAGQAATARVYDDEPKCTIITTRPNELVAPVHDRMPVILPREFEADWLAVDVSKEHALSLLQPYPAAAMVAAAALPLVNSVRNDGPGLLVADPIAA
jgi:putative SOS response-associated peptidase YedK